MKRLLLAILVCASIAPTALAGQYSVRPFLLDHTMVPRESVTDVVKLRNDYDLRTLTVYATVNEISFDADGEVKEFVSPSMPGGKNTITSWIEVTRAQIEIPAGEEREVPVTFHIDPYAEPGDYQAFIGFVPTNNRPNAQAAVMAGEADGVVVKITIADQRSDSLEVKNLKIDRFVLGDSGRTAKITLENNGDFDANPSGELIFYNSRGEEVASSLISGAAASVKSGETTEIIAIIPREADLGRYKAKLSLKYGEKQTANLYDTTFFYAMPVSVLISIFLAIVVISFLTMLLFRRTYAQEKYEDDTDEVMMYVKDGHDANPLDHDIDLSKPKD